MSLEHARNNLNQMIDRILEKNPACEIIPMVMNPVFGNGRGRRPNLPAYDDNYREVAKSGLSTDRSWSCMERITEKDPGHFLFCMPDTVHPLRAGGLAVSTAVMTGHWACNRNPEKSKDQPCFDYLCRMMDKNKDRQVTVAEFDAYWKTRYDDTDADQNGNLAKRITCRSPLPIPGSGWNGIISFPDSSKI